MRCVLGLDLSTQGVTALLLEVDAGKILARSRVSFGADFPSRNHPEGFLTKGNLGEVHADPLLWLDGLQLVLDRLAQVADLAEISAVAVSGQQHGSVYLAEGWVRALQGVQSQSALSASIAPYLSRKTSPIWMDDSTGEDCERLTMLVGGDTAVSQLTGSVATRRFTGPQISRFARTQPDNWERTARVHLVSSFITSVLTGIDAPLDTGDAAGMNLMDITRGEWSSLALKATAPGLAERLPAISPGTTLVAAVSAYFVGRHGFKPGCQVVIGTGDNPSSLIGMGAGQPGRVVVSLGTSDTFFAATSVVHAAPAGLGHVFGNPLGGFMNLVCVRNGSLARDAIRRELGMANWEVFSQAIDATAIAENAVLPLEVDEITPQRKAGRLAVGRLVSGDTLARAVVQGQALNMRLHSRWIEIQPESLLLTGGASENPAIAQVFADVFGVSVQRLATSDSAALGAAMRGANTGLGISLSALEAQFCKPEPSTFQPRKAYASAFATLEAELKAIIGR